MKIFIIHKNRESGFTVIELIASMVIFALMFTLAGIGIVMAAKGYLITKESAHMAQKAQLAMARLNRELLEITDIVRTVTTQPDPYIIYDHIEGRRAIAKGGSQIKMFFNVADSSLPDFKGGDILIDDVRQFTLTYFKNDVPNWSDADDIKDLSSIGVEIIMSRADSEIGDKTFQTTVRPRNIER